MLQTDRAILEDVLPFLQEYRADPNGLRIDDHPLEDVIAGTVIDEPSSLDGCWGSFTSGVAVDPNTGAEYPTVDVEIVHIDLAAGTLYEYWLTEAPSDVLADLESMYLFPEPARELVGLVGTEEHKVSLEGDNLLLLEPVDASAGNYDAGNTIGFGDTSLFAESYAASTWLQGFFTVQGDYMKIEYRLWDEYEAPSTPDGPCDPDNQPCDPNNYDGMYRRIECRTP
jgi:hypothetical protein